MKKSIIKNGIKNIVKDKPLRMHMPGHKGKKRGYRYDVTEIEGADNLHNADGIIKEAQDKIAEIYNAGESLFLVDGTTAGIQAAIMASVDEGDEILIPINVHRCAFPALGFSRVSPIYYVPQTTECGFVVTKELVENLIKEHPNAKAMLIVSPDYYGNISDLNEIIPVLRENNITSIIDQAHGAHLNFLPEKLDGINNGADYVVESTHKILGAPTQGSLLHLNKNVDSRKVKKILAMLESSSPSYFLMSGIEEAVDEAQDKAQKIFTNVYRAHEAMEQEQQVDDPVQLITPSGLYDRSKFLISFPKDYDVRKELVEKYRIIPELIRANLVLFMTGIGTSQRDLNRLIGAIKGINEDLKEQGFKSEELFKIEQDLKPFNKEEELYNVLGETGEFVTLEDSEGKIALDFVVPYPPGIPILIPGSKITKENIDLIKKLLEKQIIINGLEVDGDNVLIEVRK